MNRLIACVVILSLCNLISAAGGEKNGAPNVEGTWRLTASIHNGKKVADKEIAEAAVVVIFKDGKYTFTYNGAKGDVGTYKLDAKAKPANIDLTLTEGNSKGKTQLGIYKLEADQITFAFGKVGGAERPKTFDGSQDVEVHTFKRNQ